MVRDLHFYKPMLHWIIKQEVLIADDSYVLGCWNPSEQEVEALKNNVKRRKIENDSSIGEFLT